jgi:hypothetical protein
VRDWLGSHEKKRGNWIAAYRIAAEDPESDEEDVAELREKAAVQAVEFASRERRRDLRVSMLRRVAQEYIDTEAGQRAGEYAGLETELATPQSIQISRGFIDENPDFAGANGLALDPQLIDGDAANGELHQNGVVLVGGRALELHFVAPSGDPDDESTKLYQEVSEERFARLVASLEETSFRNSLVDSDDRLGADASRDVFFERARVGLTDDTDPRPLAGSEYTYRGIRERYGMIRARESILPFDLVISGSLSDMSLGAFPRMRRPRLTPDAFLYR